MVLDLEEIHASWAVRGLRQERMNVKVDTKRDIVITSKTSWEMYKIYVQSQI